MITSGTYVLILLWSLGGSPARPATMNQEFTTVVNCEVAKAAIQRSNVQIYHAECTKK